MTPEEHLLAAAEDQVKYGHCTGSYFDVESVGSTTAWRTSSACAFGSIARSAGLVTPRGIVDPKVNTVPGADSSFAYNYMNTVPGADGSLAYDYMNYINMEELPAARLLAAQIRQEVPAFIHNPSDYETITSFSDHPSTTAEDVALMMKKAAHHDS